MPVTRRTVLRRSSLFVTLGLASIVWTNAATAKVYARRVSFVDIDAFDERLSKSMQEGFEAIDVDLSASYAKRMPPRLRAWVARVSETGGEVRFRDVTPKSRGVWVVLIEVIASIVGPIVIDEIRRALRDPANDYHAVIVGQGSDPASAALLGVEFYKRGSPSWAEAFDQSKAMKLPA
jgi:hypothetical protein